MQIGKQNDSVHFIKGIPSHYRPIQSKDEINKYRNAMAEGNYPLSMTDCEVCGINGDCGDNCPAINSEFCTMGGKE